MLTAPAPPGQRGYTPGVTTGTPEHAPLTLEEARRIAVLARLSPGDEALERLRADLGAIIAYADILAELDLEAVEPLAHPGDAADRWREDEPGAHLPPERLLALAPSAAPPFVRVPKVVG
jgi:aspartyl-tRNA(Asn)/glutamyl-tRNA(Gln) amidotransferase subunit C